MMNNTRINIHFIDSFQYVVYLWSTCLSLCPFFTEIVTVHSGIAFSIKDRCDAALQYDQKWVSKLSCSSGLVQSHFSSYLLDLDIRVKSTLLLLEQNCWLLSFTLIWSRTSFWASRWLCWTSTCWHQNKQRERIRIDMISVASVTRMPLIQLQELLKNNKL